MWTDRLYPIDEAKLGVVLDTLSRRASHAREALRILQALRRSDLVGRVFDRRCEAAARQALPGYSVHYYLSECNRRRGRCLIVTREAPNGSRQKWNFSLAYADDPRLTLERLDACIDYQRKELQRYTAAAADFPSLVAQYNSACDYMRVICSGLERILLLGDPTYR